MSITPSLFIIAELPRARTKEGLSAFTTPERICLHNVILDTVTAADLEFEPSVNVKLIAIHAKDEYGAFAAIPNTKDDGVSCLMLMIINVWRAIKDILGFRISDDKLLEQICRSITQAKINKEKHDFRESFLSDTISATDLELAQKTAPLKDTAKYSDEIFHHFPDQYAILGINDGASLETAEQAYLNILLSDATQAVKDEAKAAYLFLFIFNEISADIFPLPTMKRSLQEAVDSLAFRGLPPEEKIAVNRKMLVLCELYSALID